MKFVTKILDQTTTDFTIWTLGVKKLMATGDRESTARSFLGMLRREYGDSAVALAIVAALAHDATEPKAYITGVLTKETAPPVRTETTTERRQREARMKHEKGWDHPSLMT